MGLLKKIDLYFNGDYLCSTNQSKTCKAARLAYIERAETSKHSLAGCTLTQSRVLKRPELLKARFAK